MSDIAIQTEALGKRYIAGYQAARLRAPCARASSSMPGGP